jgi:membrane-bound ClpP family serine protease
MSATGAILLLAGCGFLLLAAEAFVPGMILGIVGGLCLVGAVGLAFISFGALIGSFVMVGVVLATAVGFGVWMAVFPYTPIGRKILLRTQLPTGESAPAPSLLGAEGKSLSPLRPAGIALINGRKVDVLAESEFVGPDETVQVIREEGIWVVVRKKV